VAKFTSKSICSSEQDTVDDGCPANSRTKGEEQRVINTTSSTEVMFSDCGAIGVIVNSDCWSTESFGDQGGDIGANGPVEVWGKDQGPIKANHAGNPEPERAHLRIKTCADGQRRHDLSNRICHRRTNRATSGEVTHLRGGEAESIDDSTR
jgi:hypothetical protein